MSREILVTAQDIAFRRTSWVDVMEALAEQAKASVMERFGRDCDLALVEVKRDEFTQVYSETGALEFIYEATFEVVPEAAPRSD